MTPNKWRRPKTGDRLLRVQFRNGLVSRHEYRADQLVWDNRGWDFDIVAVEKA